MQFCDLETLVATMCADKRPPLRVKFPDEGSVSRPPPYFRRHGSYLKLIPIRSSDTLSRVKEDFVTVLEYMI